MHQKVLFILVFLATGLSFHSCYRDAETFVPDAVQIAEYIQALKRPSQTFTLNTAEPEVIVTSGRAVFRFPAAGYYFYDDNGTVSGDIQVHIQEIYRKGDMIRENATTVTTGGQLLFSGGMFHLSMEQNGRKVRLSEDQPLQIDIPSANTGHDLPLEGMEVFRGIAIDSSSEKVPQINWERLPDTVVITSWVNPLDQLQDVGYHLTTAGYDWINCDDFDPATAFATCGMDLPPAANPVNTRVYVLYDDANTLQIVDYQWQSSGFSTRIATGRPVTIFALHVDADGQLLYSLQHRTITEGGEIQMPLEKTAIAQIRDFLDSL